MNNYLVRISQSFSFQCSYKNFHQPVTLASRKISPKTNLERFPWAPWGCEAENSRTLKSKWLMLVARQILKKGKKGKGQKHKMKNKKILTTKEIWKKTNMPTEKRSRGKGNRIKRFLWGKKEKKRREWRKRAVEKKVKKGVGENINDLNPREMKAPVTSAPSPGLGLSPLMQSRAGWDIRWAPLSMTHVKLLPKTGDEYGFSWPLSLTWKSGSKTCIRLNTRSLGTFPEGVSPGIKVQFSIFEVEQQWKNTIKILITSVGWTVGV